MPSWNSVQVSKEKNDSLGQSGKTILPGWNAKGRREYSGLPLEEKLVHCESVKKNKKEEP